MLIHAELAPDANPDPQHCIPLPLHVLSLRVLHFQPGIRLQGIVSRDFSASFLASEHRLIFLPWPWTRFYVPKAYLARFLYRFCFLNCSVLGLPSRFRSEKISRNRLEMGFVIPWKNAHSAEFRASRNSTFWRSERKGTERIPRKKIGLTEYTTYIQNSFSFIDPKKHLANTIAVPRRLFIPALQ